MALQTKYSFKIISRALRLPFLSASILPFVFGSVIERSGFNFFAFLVGLSAVLFAHLSANLANDFFDSKSGADWVDKEFYGFFGGSKLIQEGVLPPNFYLGSSLLCAGISFACVFFLGLALKSSFVFFMYFIIIVLSWQYTALPLRLSYRYLGEFFVFLLFGPAIVMGAYFIQTGIFPDLKSFFLSLIPGVLTAAILFSNEVPDYGDNVVAGKNNLVKVFTPEKSYLFYYFLFMLSYSLIIAGVLLQLLKPLALFSLIFLPIVIKAGNTLKRYWREKSKLVKSSEATILLQILIVVVLILSLL